MTQLELAAMRTPQQVMGSLEPPVTTEQAVTSLRGWEIVQRILALLLLLLALPLMAVCLVLVKCTSRGPCLFAQRRRGRGGQPFMLYKIRTLRPCTENATTLGVGREEPAVTPIGKVLRKCKLDELPQLWNVVTGSMNLVGPRPLPIALEDQLAQQIPDFAARHRVKPGLSSLGQISIVENRLGDGLLADWSERFEAELHYIRNRCVVYDLAVLMLTTLYVLRSIVPFRRTRSAQRADAPSERDTIAPHATTLVLGSPIANLDYAGVEEVIAGWIAQRQARYVAICPVHSLVTAVLDKSHRQALQHAGLNTADGVPVVWAQKLLGQPTASRVYGPTLMLHLLARAQHEGWRVGFYGGTQACLDLLTANMQQRFPAVQIVCAISPPFRALTELEDAAFTQQMQSARLDLLFVGLGCPKQERWMFAHRQQLAAVQIGVGAAFSFHAGKLRQAPALLQRLGLEWLFRLACEPRRLFWRYATTNPIYVVLLCMQLLNHWLLRRRYQRPGRHTQSGKSS